MRKRKNITTNKLHDVYVTFEKPTPEDKFKKSQIYKKISKFIKDKEFILYYENYQSFYDPETDDEYDIINDPDFYYFSFLIKKHAIEVSKEFNLQLITHDMGENFTWSAEPEQSDPWLPENCDSFDDCWDIYGDIPGHRG